MRKILWFLFTVSMVAMVGCGSVSETMEATTEGATIRNSETVETQKETSVNNDACVVYFSATGNTKTVAESISKEISAPIFSIMPTDEYTDEDLSYSNDNCRANKEQNDPSSRPEIKNDLSEATKYNTIYLGYPIWWGTNPKIIETFLDKYDLSGKTVYTFCTSGGSGIEKSVSDLQKTYTNVNIVGGQRFNNNASKDEILEWYKNLNKQ